MPIEDKIKLLPNMKLGNNKIEKKVGSGGMGSVYCAYNETLKSKVAIKILHNSSKEELQNFFKEAKAIAKLEHPNIMKIYDIEYSPELEQHYIITQLIVGKTLDSFLDEKNRLDHVEILKIITEATRGLSYAHQKGIIHRDIKPENIMRDKDNNIKLMDFGLACAVDRETQDRAKIMGTPHYMAPEQCRGEKVDARTDIYALGGTFYHLIAGHPPFHGDFNIIALLHKQINENPKPLEQVAPNISSKIAKTIKKMMEKNPHDRFQNCEELYDHLINLQNDFVTIKCPRCGKQNTKDQIFDCPRCGTQSLCLTHLLPKKQYCDYCEEMVTEAEEKSLLFDANQWLDNLSAISHSKEGGVWYIQSDVEEKSLIFSMFPHEIELKTKENSYEELINSLQVSNGLDTFEIPKGFDEIAAKKVVVKSKFSQSLAWKIKQMKFYPYPKGKSTFSILPEHPTRISFEQNLKSFAKLLSNVVRLYKSVLIPGGIMVKRNNKTIGILFTKSGVAITKQHKLEEQEFINDKEKAVKTLKEVFRRDCNKIIYREPIAFPPIRAEAIFPLPEEKVLQYIIKKISKEELQAFIPDITPLISSGIGVNKTFHWSELHARQLHHRLSSVMKWEKWFELSGIKKIPHLDAILILIAVIKELVREITNILIKNAHIYISQNRLNNFFFFFLRDAEGFSPDNQELLKIMTRVATSPKKRKQAADYFAKLGNLYAERDKINKALTYYQCAVEYSSKSVLAKCGLLDIYYMQENYEKVEEIGLELLELLKNKTDDTSIIRLQRVCELLLQVDSGLVECRKALIKIYIQNNNFPKAIVEYDHLIDFYIKSGNKEQLLKCYRNVLELDQDREDIKQELRRLELKENNQQNLEQLETASSNIKKIFLTIILIFIPFLSWQGFMYWEFSQKISLIETQIKLGYYNDAKKVLKSISNFWLLYPQIEKKIKKYNCFVVKLEGTNKVLDAEKLQKWDKLLNFITTSFLKNNDVKRGDKIYEKLHQLIETNEQKKIIKKYQRKFKK